MGTLRIIIFTIAIMTLLEGLVFVLFSEHTRKSMREMFKNKLTTIKYGLIEIIVALLILFLLAL